jgi:hypothetical protein
MFEFNESMTVLGGLFLPENRKEDTGDNGKLVDTAEIDEI